MLADNSTVTVKGNATAEEDDGWAVIAANDSTVTVEGDATGSAYAVFAESSTVTIGTEITNEDGTVTRTGNVTATGDEGKAVYAEYNSTVTVYGDAASMRDAVTADQSTVIVCGDATSGSSEGGDAVYAINDSNVTVGGNATTGGYDSCAVYADNSTATVYGDAISTGKEGVAVYAGNGASVTVAGDVSVFDEFGQAVAVIVNNSDVLIGGDVTSDLTGVYIAVGGDDQVDPSTVIVAGDITSEAADLVLHLNDALGEDEKLSDKVEIAVGSLDPSKVFACDGEGNDLTAELLESIQYIVTTDEESAAINYTGTDLFHDYDTAFAGYEITVSSDKKGYKIKSLEAGQYAEVSKNKDGTWTVLVKDGGDLVLCATLVKKDGTSKRYTVGSVIKINGKSWIVTDIDSDGIWTLRTKRTFSEEKLADPEALLKTMLTKAELADVLTNKAGDRVYKVDKKGHLVIRCESGILTAKN